MSKMTDSAKKLISDKLNLTTSAILGDPMIEMNGTNRIRIENHKGIVKYSSDMIKINTSLGTLLLCGKMMNIKSMIPEEIVILGDIEKIEYLK